MTGMYVIMVSTTAGTGAVSLTRRLILKVLSQPWVSSSMWEKCKAVLMVLLTVGIVAPSGASCVGWASGQASTSNPEPFITDRVVTVRIVMSEEDWTACQLNAQAEQYVRADFWSDGELVPDVAVRPKGNSSLRSAISSGSPRFSLKVDFNLFNTARTFRGLKKLNFNNGFSDPTLIRETLVYELFDQMGVPTPRTSFVDLWINDTHLGVYTQVEQIDKTFLARHFTRDDGDLYKPETLAAPLNWTEEDVRRQLTILEAAGQDDADDSLDINIGGGKLRDILEALQPEESAADEAAASPGVPDMAQRGIPQPVIPREGLPRQPLPGQDALQQPPRDGQQQPDVQQRDYIEAVGLKTNESSADHSALFRFLDVLNNEPDSTFPAEIEKVLDVDNVLRFLAVSTITVHLDNYLGMGHNYYLYEVDGRFAIIPWDLNMAFGTFNCSIDREGLVNFFIDEPTCGPIDERPLVQRLLSHQPYLDTYHRYMEELLEGSFSVETMNVRIDELVDLIHPYVEADELKFFSTGDFERAITEDMRGAMLTPDRLPGDMPQGQAPQEQVPQGKAPPIVLPLSPENLACLRKQISLSTLQELRTRPPTTQELQRIRSCLTRDELSAFLQNLRGQTELQQQPVDPRQGPAALGLKTFIAERVTSVRQQLDGERPSAGDGSGNGGSTTMFNRQDGLPDNALPREQPTKGVQR